MPAHSSLEFRPAVPSDVATCVEIRGRTRENAVSAKRLSEVGITVASWSESVRRGSLPGYVCLADGDIVGYCFGATASGEIEVLALLPEFENQGIGKVLLAHVVETLSGIGFTRLLLGCSSDPASRSYGFYRHLGWRSTGTFDARGDELLEYFVDAINKAPLPNARCLMPNTALLIIDVQRGAFDGVLHSPINQPDTLIESATRLLNAARSGGAPVVFIQHCDGPGELFAVDTPQWALHEALVLQPGEAVVQKRASSAFEDTDLAQVLADMNADSLVLCGLQSEFCVSNTAKSALTNGFKVTIAQDGHSTWPSGERSADAIKAQVNAALAAAGAELETVDDLVAALRVAKR